MTVVEKPEYLRQQIRLLVSYFGASAVQRVLAEVLAGAGSPGRGEAKSAKAAKAETLTTSRLSFDAQLKRLTDVDPVRHDLLAAFATQVRRGELLSEAQDIRQFAQVAGVKSLKGHDRRELVGSLLVAMLALSPDRLAAAIKQASSISERERRQGFSVLTDKLIRD